MRISDRVYISASGEVIFSNQLDKLSQPMAGSMMYDFGINTANLFSLNIKEPFRKKGYAKKLRTATINKILERGIKIITTFPQSYTDEFKTEDLTNFYIKHFKECGAKKVESEDSHQIKLTATFE